MSKVRAYKMTIIVLDFEPSSEENIRYYIEDHPYAVVRVKESESLDIDWSDDHPLNKKDGDWKKVFQNE